MFRSEFYSVALLLSRPGLTNQLPGDLPHKRSQVINNNNKMAMLPPHPCTTLFAFPAATQWHVAPAGWSAGFLGVHGRVTTFTPSYASLPYTQGTVQSQHRGIRENANRAPIVSGLGSNPRGPTSRGFQNGKRSMVFCKHVAIFTSDGFIQMLQGNVAALQSRSVLAFPAPLRFVWERHLWRV